jgi:hypothetical protein
MLERFTREEQPEYLSATDAWFFKQGNTVGNAFIVDADSGVGEFDAYDELEDIASTDTYIGNQKIRISKKYAKQIPVSAEAFRADMVGKRQSIGEQVGKKARQTQDKQAIARTYADAFNGILDTCDDGVNLASASHITLRGVTIDNLETPALDPDGLWTCVQTLANQKGQDGDAGSHVFKGLLVPFGLYKKAKETLDSSLIADSAENNINIFDTIYGQVRVKESIFLDSTYNSNTNAATSYHVLGEDHQISRKVFYGLNSEMVEPKYSTNDAWNFRWSYNEMAYPGSWTAYVGCNGTT